MRHIHLPTEYSTQLEKRILKPRSVGILTDERKEEMRLFTGEAGSFDEGNWIRFYVLIDTTDGVIADVKFQAFGESALIGSADILAEMLLRKTYDQAGRITADLIDTHVRDRSTKEAFPKETFGHINLTLEALDRILARCRDIPLKESYEATPVDLSHLGTGEYPNWEAMSIKERLDTIHNVIETDVQPYVALDEGKVVIKEFISDLKLLIGYEGSCTTCYSSTGSTLSAIQGILRMKVHPELTVVPDLTAHSHD